MTALVTSPPALEPVTLAEARAHLRVTTTAEDALIERLVATARAEVERLTRRALINQGWRLYLDSWPPGRVVRFPVAPVASVDSLTVYDKDGLPVVLPPDTYTPRLNSEPPGFAVATGAGGLAPNGIEIDFTAGYGAAADDVPEPLRQAVLLLAGFWFERRDGLAEAGSPQGLGLPGSLAALISGYRRVRL